jgi:hypothetical protein
MSRRRQPKIPESEQRDAYVEFDGETGFWCLQGPGGTYSMVIAFCPWCGSDLEAEQRLAEFQSRNIDLEPQ